MSDFQSLQQQFAAYIRDPHNSPLPPGCDVARMQHYHQLFFNNFDGVLANAFPRLSASLPDADWRKLTQHFFQTEPQHSPYLGDVPARFAEFLTAQSDPPLKDGYIELMAYELAAFDLKRSADGVVPAGLIMAGDWRTQIAMIHPDSVLFESVFAVHEPSFDPSAPITQPSFICLLRDADGLVQPHVLSAASAQLLALLAEQSRPGRAIVAALANQLQQPLAVLEPLVDIQIAQWRAQGIVVGFIASFAN
jgi:hypothetical protein